MGTGRDCKSRLELGNSWGMVRPVYMHSVCTIGATSRDCMSLAITVNNLFRELYPVRPPITERNTKNK